MRFHSISMGLAGWAGWLLARRRMRRRRSMRMKMRRMRMRRMRMRRRMEGGEGGGAGWKDV